MKSEFSHLPNSLRIVSERVCKYSVLLVEVNSNLEVFIQKLENLTTWDTLNLEIEIWGKEKEMSHKSTGGWGPTEGKAI